MHHKSRGQQCSRYGPKSLAQHRQTATTKKHIHKNSLNLSVSTKPIHNNNPRLNHFVVHIRDLHQSKPQLSKNYWTNESAQRKALESFGKELGVTALDDWYSINAGEVKRKLSFIINHYNGSLFTALKTLYPHHNWNPLRLSNVPRGFWNNEDTQRAALEQVGQQLGVKELDDWYHINPIDVSSELSFINNQYNSSLFTALKKLYPHHDWNPLKISTQVPQGYWNNKDNQRNALETFGRSHGVKELDDWYSINPSKVRSELGFIITHYNSSLFTALKTLYPHHNWDPLRLSKVPRGFWHNEDAQRAALERVGTQLGVKKLDDWYKISVSRVKRELSFLISHYNNSLFAALKKLYPHHNWNPLQFSKAPNGFWKNINTQELIQWMDHVKKQYSITAFSDWVHLPRTQLNLLEKMAYNVFGSKAVMLRRCFPDQSWNEDLSSSAFERKLKSDFSIENIKEFILLYAQFLVHITRTTFSHYSTHKHMWRMITTVEVHTTICGHSIDIYLPQFSLAIEYQGKPHYEQIHLGSWKGQLQRDEQKRKDLKEHGIELLAIPYWWNGSWSQILSTLQRDYGINLNS